MREAWLSTWRPDEEGRRSSACAGVVRGGGRGMGDLTQRSLLKNPT